MFRAADAAWMHVLEQGLSIPGCAARSLGRARLHPQIMLASLPCFGGDRTEYRWIRFHTRSASPTLCTLRASVPGGEGDPDKCVRPSVDDRQ
jgi:hypothetical protein